MVRGLILLASIGVSILFAMWSNSILLIIIFSFCMGRLARALSNHIEQVSGKNNIQDP